MSKLVVVDANVLVALINQRDVFHARAEALWSTLTSVGVEEIDVVLFDCVMTETISVLARRMEDQKRSNEFSLRLDELLQRFPLVAWFWVSDFARPWTPEILDLMRATSGQLNFNDALIATACQKFGDVALLSFDADFDQVGGLLRIATAQDAAQLR